MVKLLASKLRDVELITDTGIRLGWVYDLSFDENTGEILVIVAEPDEDLDTSEFVTDSEGLLLIPVKAIKSVGEVIIIDAAKLAVKSKIRTVPKLKPVTESTTTLEKKPESDKAGKSEGLPRPKPKEIELEI